MTHQTKTKIKALQLFFSQKEKRGKKKKDHVFFTELIFLIYISKNFENRELKNLLYFSKYNYLHIQKFQKQEALKKKRDNFYILANNNIRKLQKREPRENPKNNLFKKKKKAKKFIPGATLVKKNTH